MGDHQERVNVNNEDLKRILIKKMQTPGIATTIEEKHFEAEPNKEPLNRIDKYNLDYALNKIHHQSERPQTKESMQFPKIAHIQTKSVLYPKSRERGINSRHEIKRRFEENLRNGY